MCIRNNIYVRVRCRIVNKIVSNRKIYRSRPQHRPSDYAYRHGTTQIYIGRVHTRYRVSFARIRADFSPCGCRAEISIRSRTI